jgi:hypothetical protein
MAGYNRIRLRDSNGLTAKSRPGSCPTWTARFLRLSGDYFCATPFASHLRLSYHRARLFKSPLNSQKPPGALVSPPWRFSFWVILRLPIEMSEKRGMPVFRERVIINGVACNVSVHVVGKLFRASWFCGACSNRSVHPFWGATADAAAELAKADLTVHHAKLHTRPSR